VAVGHLVLVELLGVQFFGHLGVFGLGVLVGLLGVLFELRVEFSELEVFGLRAQFVEFWEVDVPRLHLQKPIRIRIPNQIDEIQKHQYLLFH